MKDRFEISLVNDSIEFDAMSAAAVECGINDECYQNLDYADGCEEIDSCGIDYT